MTNYIARVSEHTILASTFHFLRLELIKPHLIDFQAGQYISLSIDKNTGLRRSYSIASVPSMNHAIDLLVGTFHQGPGSKYIQDLKPGDQVEFMGPMGNFIVSNFELLFIATGCGISPIRSMILDQLIRLHNSRPIRLWWGMRREEDCFWEEDFDLLEREHPNFKWDLILSQPPENWPLHAGHVTEHIINYINSIGHLFEPEALQSRRPEKRVGEQRRVTVSDLNNLHFYVCGGRDTVNDISTKLKENGIKSTQIHFEKFGSSS